MAGEGGRKWVYKILTHVYKATAAFVASSIASYDVAIMLGAAATELAGFQKPVGPRENPGRTNISRNGQCGVLLVLELDVGCLCHVHSQHPLIVRTSLNVTISFTYKKRQFYASHVFVESNPLIMLCTGPPANDRKRP